MYKTILLSLLTVLSGCGLPEIKIADLSRSMRELNINDQQIQSTSYCTMGFIDPELKRYWYYDEEEKRFKNYDTYILEKCVFVRTNDKLIILPRKGSEIGSHEIISIRIDELEGVGLYKKGAYRQLQLKVQDKTIVLELLKSTGFPADAETTEELLEYLQKTGASIFEVKQPPIHVLPQIPYINW